MNILVGFVANLERALGAAPPRRVPSRFKRIEIVPHTSATHAHRRPSCASEPRSPDTESTQIRVIRGQPVLFLATGFAAQCAKVPRFHAASDLFVAANGGQTAGEWRESCAGVPNSGKVLRVTTTRPPYRAIDFLAEPRDCGDPDRISDDYG